MIDVIRVCATACNALMRPHARLASPIFLTLRTATAIADLITFGRSPMIQSSRVSAAGILVRMKINAFHAMTGSPAAKLAASVKQRVTQILKYIPQLI